MVGIVLAIVSGVTNISGTKCERDRVTKNATADPIDNKPSNCLISPLTTMFHFLYTHPTQTALEGLRNGAAHIAPIITGTLLASKPPVARRADVTTRAK